MLSGPPHAGHLNSKRHFTWRNQRERMSAHLGAAFPFLWWLLLQVAELPWRTPVCLGSVSVRNEGLRVWEREERELVLFLYLSCFDFQSLSLCFSSPLWGHFTSWMVLILHPCHCFLPCMCHITIGFRIRITFNLLLSVQLAELGSQFVLWWRW